MQHLIETGQVPVGGEAVVSRKLLEACTSFPQPEYMLEQTARTGAVGYREFWESGRPKYRPDHPPVELYQAQHSALYYRLAYPLFAIMGGTESLALSIASLRIVNLLLGTIAMATVFWLIGKLFDDRVLGGLLVVAISLHPLYLINVCRVANDALAVLLGTLVIVWTLRASCWRPMTSAAVIGVLLGTAVWAKGTNLALIAFVPIAFAGAAALRNISWRQAGIQSAIALSAAAVLLGPQFAQNLSQYGVLIPMQEAIHNHQHGRGFIEIVQRGLLQLNIVWHLIALWFGCATFLGGWSFLSFPLSFTTGFCGACLAALAGWLCRCLPRKPRCGPETIVLQASLQIGGLVGCMSLALTWHLFQSNAAWGQPTTNFTYPCVATPFLMMLVLLGGFQCARAIGWFYGVGLTVVLWLCGYIGVALYMIPAYSQSTGWMAFSRLGQLQPGWPASATVMVAIVVAIASSVLVAASWLATAFADSSASEETLRESELTLRVG